MNISKKHLYYSIGLLVVVCILVFGRPYARPTRHSPLDVSVKWEPIVKDLKAVVIEYQKRELDIQALQEKNAQLATVAKTYNDIMCVRWKVHYDTTGTGAWMVVNGCAPKDFL